VSKQPITQTHVVDLETEHVSPKKAHLSQEDNRLHVFFLMNAANFVKIKQDITSLKLDIYLMLLHIVIKTNKFMK
jgi:hypothetical protein